MKTTSFNELPVSQEIIRAIENMGFSEATPIQSESIPHILEGRDILGQAQTGTGKTCAFGIPVIDRVDPENDRVQFLILSPTRELAMQIADELREVSQYKEGVRIQSVYGGQPIGQQILSLKRRPQIIVGTPGRIMDHMRRKTIRLDHLQGIILDEADEMLNMGFKEDIDTILSETPEKIQRIFFSATMPRGILELTDKYLADPIHVRIEPKQMTVHKIKQYYIEVRAGTKLEVLCRLIDAEQIKLALIFCNTKKRVDELAEMLRTRGYKAEALHGDMNQRDRSRVMGQFKNGQVQLLVATDVAARGIDVDDIEVVLNFDLPQDDEYYVHRIGRTGRAGKSGKAYTFVVGREIISLRNIQRFTQSKISSTQPPTIKAVTDKRVAVQLDQLRSTLENADCTQYSLYIEEFLEQLNHDADEDQAYTATDLAAALLQQAMADTLPRGEDIKPVVPYEDFLARSAPAKHNGSSQAPAKRGFSQRGAPYHQRRKKRNSASAG